MINLMNPNPFNLDLFVFYLLLYYRTQYDNSSFLNQSIVIMQKQINQISLKIAFNLLNDHILEKNNQILQMHQKFAREFQSKHQPDLHQWLIIQTKNINQSVKTLMEGTKDYFSQIQFGFIYDFFEKCSTTIEQSSKHLSQALAERINRKLNIERQPIIPNRIVPQVLGGTSQQPAEANEEKLKRCGKQINRDLQSLDYFLNLLTYDDNKTYEEYKSQCDKILLQRQLLENIKPSQASKQIMEATNMIENVLENSDKVFQDSYMLKYLQFKSFMNTLHNPHELPALFKEEMERQTKQKFKDGMSRTLKQYQVFNKQQKSKHLINSSSQTQEKKTAKAYEKLQNLLVIQKKNNQRLATELRWLKKNKSIISQPLQLQKLIEQQDSRIKQIQNKYKILEAMYNKKCEEMQGMTQPQYFAGRQYQKQTQKRSTICTSIQTQNSRKATSVGIVQTDVDFYYYFQSKKIYDYKVKIIQLEDILKHKEYIIQQMEAIRTFRDHFKSKKQLYTTAIRSTRKFQKAKSLHYLNEDDQVFDLKSQERFGPSSIQNNTKKKVTLKDLEEQQIRPQMKTSMSRLKKEKKKTEFIKNKAYFALNDKVQDKQQPQILQSQMELQKVSLRSILKLGNNQFKKEFGMQTDPLKRQFQNDCIAENKYIQRSKIERAKLNSRQKLNSREKLTSKQRQSTQNTSKQKMRTSQTYNLRQTISEQRKSFQKSKFITLQLSQNKGEFCLATTANNLNMTKSQLSPMKVIAQKPKNLKRSSKWNQNKINTAGDQLLHVNNTLNFNFLIPINTTLRQSISNSVFKNQSKYESIKKGKVQHKIL